jgi:hypothetical protein
MDDQHTVADLIFNRQAQEIIRGPHICNYASRHKPQLCRRLVTDGERYCWQHRPQGKKDR